MKAMSTQACRVFLEQGSRTAKVATVRKDGRPHVTPVWFVLDDHDLVFMTHERSVKGRTLQREPRVMISVDDDAFPFGFVLAEGTADCARLEPSELLPRAREIAKRYVPPEMIESTASRNAVLGELLVRVRLSKLSGWSEVAG